MCLNLKTISLNKKQKTYENRHKKTHSVVLPVLLGQLITSLLPLTVVPCGEVPAALTLSSLGVATVAVPVALARLALREAPEAR